MEKQELKQVLGEVFDEKFDEKLEPFATAIQSDIRSLKNEMKEESLGLKDDVSYIRHWTSMLDVQIEDIKQQLDKVVYRHELESLRERVEKLEEVVKSVKGNNF